MSTITFTEAFSRYGAKLANPQWAFSAIAEDGALVLSLWSHKFSRPEKGVLRYEDRLSRWNINSAGKNLFVAHLSEAHKHQLPVRLVIATTSDTGVIDAGKDASGIEKTFHVREDIVGRVVVFDGDAYVVDFVRFRRLGEARTS